MDEPVYFVRFRGRVSGPFPLPQLKTLVRRGQVTRMHELSSDRRRWWCASEDPDLFPPPEPSAGTEAASQTQDILDLAEQPASPAAEAEAASAAEPPPRWYYAVDDRESGPVETAELQRLAGEGTIMPTTLVWRPGLPNWIPATEVRELGFAAGPLTDAEEATASPRAATTWAHVLIRVYSGMIFLAGLALAAVAVLLPTAAGLAEEVLPQAARDEAMMAAMVGVITGILLVILGAGLWMFKAWAWVVSMIVLGLGLAFSVVERDLVMAVAMLASLAVLTVGRRACGIGG